MTIEAIVRPPVKWVGGKTQLLPELVKHVPERFGRYYEPFVGGGALFFHLKSLGWPLAPRFPIPETWARLSDINPRLVAMYRGLRDDVDRVVRALRGYAKLYEESGSEFYYKARDEQPLETKGDAAMAAWVIMMNKTCFNGLWRENKSGKFNVPAGSFRSPPTICDEENLRAVSRALHGVLLVCEDFVARYNPVAGDFWYADPPYWPVSTKADFTAYSKEAFGPAQQERLRDEALSLKRQGVRVLLSNADVEPVRKLYAHGFEMRRIEARRAVNSDAKKRGPVGELLIW